MSESDVIPGDAWPSLPLDAWSDTYATLHLWTQIVGKIRLAQTPWTNHSWHVTLSVTARGLTTGSIPYGTRAFQIDFDFIAHELNIQCDDGRVAGFPLEPQSVAVFYRRLRAEMKKLGLEVKIYPKPNEVPDAMPFDQDEAHAAYDPDYAESLLARAFAKRSHFQNLSRTLRRQVQSGALLLGGARFGRHAIFRPARSSASRRRSQSSRSRRSRGLFARGQ